MAENSAIEWTDSTFNPWIGCTRVSPGCDNCYAAAQDKFRKWTPEGWGGPRRRTSVGNWQMPQRWDRIARQEGRRFRVFCASLADVFEGRDDLRPTRERLWGLVRRTPNLDWQILTKRPEAIPDLMPPGDWPNVWLGTSVETQEYLWRADALRDAPQRVPVRFLSCEPLLGPLSLWDVLAGLQWVIVGGESGGEARPCRLAWVRDIILQCADQAVACFVKQLGRRPVLPATPGLLPVAIHDSKGGDWDEWPRDLRVRQFPGTAIQGG